MAAPTAVRVESNSITTAILRWTYGGNNPLAINRSTDGSSYSVVDTIVASSTSFTDTGLSSGTRYWYKISDDSGATFSSVVTVVTHSCSDELANSQAFGLPRFDGSEQQAADLNAMAERIEAVLGDVVLSPDQCIACPENGAVVVDCSDHCLNWYVVADEDINSVTIENCPGNGSVNFIVPPNTNGRQICGFPAGFGFTGDECLDFPITTGTKGRTVAVGWGPSGGGVSGGGGGGRAKPGSTGGKPGYGGTSDGERGNANSCACTPGSEGQLTIKCCTENCSLDCSSSLKEIQLRACGGIGPYDWTKTGNNKFKGNGDETTDTATATGPVVYVRPPANTGGAVAGTAYAHDYYQCTSCGGGSSCTTNNTFQHIDYGCDDVSDGCFVPADGHTHCSGTVPAVGSMTCNGAAAACLPTCSGGCPSPEGVIAPCDARTAGMITDGCQPCGANAIGATITVTDAVGTAVTISLVA